MKFNNLDISKIMFNSTQISKAFINGENLIPTGIVTDGLVLWLDGTDFTNSPPTTTWIDKSGSENNATPSGFAYTSLSGSDSRGGVVFDGVDDYTYINPTSSFNFGSQDFTIQIKVKRNSLNSIQRIISQCDYNGTASSRSFEINFLANNTVMFRVASSSVNYSATSTLTLADSNYHFVEMVRRGNMLYGYVDEVLWTSLDITGIVVNSSSNKLAIGRQGEGSMYYLNGSVENLLIYKEIGLTIEQLQQNANILGRGE